MIRRRRGRFREISLADKLLAKLARSLSDLLKGNMAEKVADQQRQLPLFPQVMGSYLE